MPREYIAEKGMLDTLYYIRTQAMCALKTLPQAMCVYHLLIFAHVNK